MTQPQLHIFGPETPVPETYWLAPEKLLAGNPRQSVWLDYTDVSGKFCAGVWHSEVGKWRIAYTEEEYCELLEGVSVVTDQQGRAVTLVAGSRFVIPRGFIGSWEVLEPTRKRFVLFDSGVPLERP